MSVFQAAGPLPRGGGVGRRDFLVWGSAVVSGLCIQGQGWTRAADAGAAPARFSVGYVEGSEQWPEAVLSRLDAVGEELSVVPASRLPGGDPMLAVEGVRLRVLGTWPSARELAPERLPASAELEVVLPPLLETGEEPRHYAWALQARRPVSVSPPVGFRVPVERDRGLVLDVAVRPAAAAGFGDELRRGRVVFTTGDEPGLPRLVPGLYLVALTSSVWDQRRRLLRDESPVHPVYLSLALTVERIVTG